MTNHCTAPTVEESIYTNRPVVLVGNPNVGKSVIFGKLTGRYVTVSNYPGTTVEIAQGALSDGMTIIDTPGTNTLHGSSDDERVTAQVLQERRDSIRAVVQVADAKNLRRALLLTVQLTDLEVPLVLNLNMADEAEANGVHIDTAQLSERLGIDVVTTVATRGKGLDELRSAIDHAHLPAYRVLYTPASGQPARSHRLSQQLAAVDSLLQGVVSHHNPQSAHPANARRLSRLATHALWGWPILMIVLFVMYKFVGEFGAGTLVGIMEDTVFGEWLNPLATRIVDTLLPIPFVHDLLVGQYGVITMALTYGLALVLPIVATFFIAFSILEDSGYLPRLAVMLNRAFQAMGLNGKAVLPMVLGLGCDTMATMTTRILETRKERIMVTLLLALGVPCSAQLGVILGMLGTVGGLGVLIWAGVVIGTMLIVGLLAAKLLPGERGDFIMELPPMRLPRLENILIKTLARLEWYLKEVLPLFVVGTLILFVMDITGALAVVEQLTAPVVVGLLGLPPAAAGAFLIGFLRRDYGAAGLFALALAGQFTPAQTLVSLIVITLFIPCIANVLMIVKEYGGRVALGMVLTVFPLAFAVGGLVNAALRLFHIVL